MGIHEFTNAWEAVQRVMVDAGFDLKYAIPIAFLVTVVFAGLVFRFFKWLYGRGRWIERANRLIVGTEANEAEAPLNPVEVEATQRSGVGNSYLPPALSTKRIRRGYYFIHEEYEKKIFSDFNKFVVDSDGGKSEYEQRSVYANTAFFNAILKNIATSCKSEDEVYVNIKLEYYGKNKTLNKIKVLKRRAIQENPDADNPFCGYVTTIGVGSSLMQELEGFLICDQWVEFHIDDFKNKLLINAKFESIG